MSAEPQSKRRLLRLPAVLEMTGMKKSSIYRFIASPDERGDHFPNPIKVGRSSHWIESEVQAWIDRQCEAATTSPVAA